MDLLSNENILSVSDLNRAVKKNLESKFFEVRVRGEVTNLKRGISGHTYFSLKDEQSQISVVLFNGTSRLMSRLPNAGDQVIVCGKLSVYEPRGSYQIIVKSIKFDGAGDLLLKFHEMKERLKKEGLFDPQIKKRVPVLPKVIGIVTSPSGAVIRDIMYVFKRKYASGGSCNENQKLSFNVIINPVRVQGSAAVREISFAIDEFNALGLVDVIIVCRGGGSLEDLFAFNEECMARAIHRSKIPVISAVGHETDFLISDFVSDMRMATPTAAAEFLSGRKRDFFLNLNRMKLGLDESMAQLIDNRKNMVERYKYHSVFVDPYSLIRVLEQKLDRTVCGLRECVKLGLDNCRMRLSHVNNLVNSLNIFKSLEMRKMRLFQLIYSIIENFSYVKELRRSVDAMASALEGMNFKKLLDKGYCLVSDDVTGDNITSVGEVCIGKNISLQFKDGVVKSVVSEIFEGEEISSS